MVCKLIRHLLLKKKKGGGEGANNILGMFTRIHSVNSDHLTWLAYSCNLYTPHWQIPESPQEKKQLS